MADIKQIYNDLSSANMNYQSAVSRKAGVAAAKDRVKNLFFNHKESILSALQGQDFLFAEIDRPKEKCSMLEDELDAVDAENNDLRRKLREYESAPQKKTKKKTAVVE
jgi:hypothetical protein